MSRKGRELEVLIAKLEGIGLPQGATIESPGWLEDRITSNKREVDVVIEYLLGTCQIRIVIECRDRDDAEDSTWIEQMHTKLMDVHAHKMIAVSSEGFTSPALEKAKHYNIETRTYQEIDSELVKSWWLVPFIKHQERKVLVTGVAMATNGEGLENEIVENQSLDDKILFRTTDGTAYSINEVAVGFANNLADWDKLIPNGPSIPQPIHATYTNPEDRLFIKRHGQELDVLEIALNLELSIVEYPIPLARVYQYAAGDKSLSEVIEFDSIGPLDVIQFIRGSDGSLSISARKAPPHSPRL